MLGEILTVIYLFAVVCHPSTGQTEECSSGFLSDQTEIGAVIEGAMAGNSLDRRQWIMPSISFTCNGSVTKWIVGALWDNTGNDRTRPELQIWRMASTQPNTYFKVGGTLLSVNEEMDEVYEVSPTDPLELQSGDILGLYQPQASQTRLIVYFDTNSGPNNYYIRNQKTPLDSFTITGSGISTQNASPLIAVVVSAAALEPSPSGLLPGVVELSSSYARTTPLGSWSSMSGNAVSIPDGQSTNAGSILGGQSTNAGSIPGGQSTIAISTPGGQSTIVISTLGAQNTIDLVPTPRGHSTVTASIPGGQSTLRGGTLATAMSMMLSSPSPVQSISIPTSLTEAPSSMIMQLRNEIFSTFTPSQSVGETTLDLPSREISSSQTPSLQPTVTTPTTSIARLSHSNAAVPSIPTTTTPGHVGGGGRDSSESSSDDGLIAGVTIAAVVVAILIALGIVTIAMFVFRRRKRAVVKFNKHNNKIGDMNNPIYSDLATTSGLMIDGMSQTEAASYEQPISYQEQSQALLDMNDLRSTIPTAHYEKAIHVPTQEQRESLIISSHSHLYATLGKVQLSITRPAPTFFEESDTYWMPSYNQNELYAQLARKRYREIPRNQIQLTNHLGSGQFGTVSGGLWQSAAGVKEVAVKTLQAGASESDNVKFLQEAAINGQFQHPNIVRLLGVVTIGSPIMIVLELLSNGDLTMYVKRLRPAPGELLPSNTPQLLLRFCRQIAAGMTYLSAKAFVHRDLAARNILVSQDKTCKISDFGMSRDLENESYYLSHGGKIPVKWTAPEALFFKKYSTASDVWSYGMLLYEIWSLGHKPFEDYTNQHTIDLVNSGYRLPPPPGCPKEIYRVMVNCWHLDKGSRPTFAALVNTFSSPDSELLLWRREDCTMNPMAQVIGGPMDAGKDLHLELQNA